MSAIDQAKAHYTRQGVRVIEVPEWGEDGKPLLVYATPMTLSDKAKLYEIGERYGAQERNAHILIMKATDAQGNKMFTLEDKHALMHAVDGNVLIRVAVEINTSVSVEQAEKN